MLVEKDSSVTVAVALILTSAPWDLTNATLQRSAVTIPVRLSVHANVDMKVMATYAQLKTSVILDFTAATSMLRVQTRMMSLGSSVTA